MTKLKFRKQPITVKIIYVSFFVMFLFFAAVYIYPLLWAFINSLKSMKEYAMNSLSMPSEWLWRHYREVFTEFQAVPLSGGEPFRYMDMLFTIVARNDNRKSHNSRSFPVILSVNG